MTYGVFSFNAPTIAILVIIAIMLLVLAAVFYHIRWTPVGAVSHLTGGVLVLICLMTWWTEGNWSGEEGGIGFLMFLGSAVTLLGASVLPLIADR